MFGYAVGALTPLLIAKLFNVPIEGATIYIVLGIGFITAVLGVLLMGSIFEANFVCDETLQDPLFDYLPDVDRR